MVDLIVVLILFWGEGGEGFIKVYQVAESFVHHVQDNIRVILKVTLCLVPSFTPVIHV